MSIQVASADRLGPDGRLRPRRRGFFGPPPPPLGTAFTPTLVWGAPAFDPATLLLTGWWRADDYVAATGIWTSRASAGTSGLAARSTTSGSATNGAALNGHTTISFAAGSSQSLALANAASSDFVAAAPATWSYSALVRIASVQVLANPWVNAPTLGDNGFGFNVGFASSGGLTVVRLEDNNGGAGPVTNYDSPLATWVGVQGRSNGASMDVRTIVAGVANAWVSKAAPTNLSLGTHFVMGLSNGGHFFDGLIADHLVSDQRFDDATLDKIWQSYYRSRYGGVP